MAVITIYTDFESESESEVAQSCPTLRDHMDCSLPVFSVHRIFQARILEWAAISFSRGSSKPRDRTRVSHVVGRCFYRLSHRVIAFLLISWLQSPSAVILEPKKIKSLTVSIVSPSICHEEMGPDAMALVF